MDRSLDKSESYRINADPVPISGWKHQDREKGPYDNEESLIRTHTNLGRDPLPDNGFERVRSIAEGNAQSQPASYIADETHVSENIAENHLQRLVEMSVLRKSDQEGKTVYAPDPLHTRKQSVRDLLDDNDQNELIKLKANMQEHIQRWRNEYEVQSPTELRERAVDTSNIAEERYI